MSIKINQETLNIENSHNLTCFKVSCMASLPPYTLPQLPMHCVLLIVVLVRDVAGAWSLVSTDRTRQLTVADTRHVGEV